MIIDDGFGLEFDELFPEQFVHTGFRLEAHDMTTALMDGAVPKTICQDRNERTPAQIARQFYTSASNSSRTRCKRTDSGSGRSKQYASTASLALYLNSDHEAPCVNMS